MAVASEVPLAARTAVAALAVSSVGAASRAAAALSGAGPIDPDPLRVAVAYTSERWFRIRGVRPAAFAPLSGFFPTRDGWVRTHGNYPHHAAALRAALRLDEVAGRDEVAAALGRWDAGAAAAAVTARGGLCVVVAEEVPSVDSRLRAKPVVEVTRLGPAPPRPLPPGSAAAPLRGIRVLDLTRVIAGPVATRTLALLGADVLRIDPPQLPEIAWQHLDTGHGKRSALLDLTVPRGRRRLAELLADADIVVLGYRPASLDRFGLRPGQIAAAHPGVIVVRHSAWGGAHGRGFDSLVQAASGLAWIESADGTVPGALPAQALDHSAGYLLAAHAMTLLSRRAEEGGSWLVETSLRRIAAELLGAPRRTEPLATAPLDPTGHVQDFDVDGVDVMTTAPALAYHGAPTRFARPRPWGRDRPEWRI